MYSAHRLLLIKENPQRFGKKVRVKLSHYGKGAKNYGYYNAKIYAL